MDGGGWEGGVDWLSLLAGWLAGWLTGWLAGYNTPCLYFTISLVVTFPPVHFIYSFTHSHSLTHSHQTANLAVTAERSYEYKRLANSQQAVPVPSVPRREQSYGYEDVMVDVAPNSQGVRMSISSSNNNNNNNNQENGGGGLAVDGQQQQQQQRMRVAVRACKPLPNPTDIYTGIGGDTVGPSFYEPNGEADFLNINTALSVGFSNDCMNELLDCALTHSLTHSLDFFFN
jgi:hypothetical protein